MPLKINPKNTNFNIFNILDETFFRIIMFYFMIFIHFLTAKKNFES